MKKLLYLAGLMLVFVACDSGLEGTGESVEEARIVAPFEVLVVESNINVRLFNLKRGEEPKVVVHAEGNLQPYILTEVRDPKLTLRVEEELRSSTGISVDVYCNNRLKLIHRGTGEITASEVFKFVDLYLQNEGSGDIVLEARGDELQVKNDGSGTITLTGKAKDVNIQLDGAGDVSAHGFKVRTAEVRNEGSGNLSVHARQELEATLEGSGDIRYLYEGADDDLDLEQDGTGQMVRLAQE